MTIIRNKVTGSLPDVTNYDPSSGAIIDMTLPGNLTANLSVNTANLSVTGETTLSDANIGNVTATTIVASNVTSTILSTGVANISVQGNTITALTDITIDPYDDGGPTGNVFVLGNLQVTGNLTYVDASTALTSNLLWQAADTASTPLQASGAGLAVGPVGNSYATITYNQPSNVWNSSLGISTTGNVTAGAFYGNGASLSSINGANVTGNVALSARANNISGNSGDYSIVVQSPTGVSQFLPNGLAGEVLISEGAGYTPIWVNPSVFGSTRAYELAINSNSTLSTVLGNQGITDVNGAIYSIYNNSSSVVTLNVGGLSSSLVNGSSTSGTVQVSPGVLSFRPYETITLQTVSAGAQYAFMCSTQPQTWYCVAYMGSQGVLPSNTDTLLNFVTNGGTTGYDPTGSFNNGTHTWTAPRGGLWLITLQTSLNNSSSSTGYQFNSQIRIGNPPANANAPGTIGWGWCNPNGVTNTLTLTVMAYITQGTQCLATAYPYGTSTLSPTNNTSGCAISFQLIG